MSTAPLARSTHSCYRVGLDAPLLWGDPQPLSQSPCQHLLVRDAARVAMRLNQGCTRPLRTGHRDSLGNQRAARARGRGALEVHGEALVFRVNRQRPLVVEYEPSVVPTETLMGEDFRVTQNERRVGILRRLAPCTAEDGDGEFERLGVFWNTRAYDGYPFPKLVFEAFLPDDDPLRYGEIDRLGAEVLIGEEVFAFWHPDNVQRRRPVLGNRA